ncbi:cupin domain-containing protein [Salmonella enterica]|nr:cupin domain-containing protein [Salmonella enterica subsp. enterica serovar Oranienburg]EAA7484463.1 cupin domain-containing protein [Salmonella enterica subsp. enterica serovar Irumu]EAY4424165.1 cupin domain-containing protein [Salmonella enterica]ECI0430395.1 cupin domain-containing protein [Salmonella enterica subsp. enterica serovar Soumbedioune]ECT9500470.1 cupin domain-containing protein [Salmonella enterica subsp. enterica serovar Infantis]EEJ2343474.1 cupin domain-containing prote
MIRFTSVAASLLLVTGVSAYGETATSAQMKLSQTGSRATIAEPANHFTGRAYIDPLFSPVAPQRAGAAWVTFVPGARADWHTHPLGQTLVMTSGTGWVQEWGGERKTVHAGDIIQYPPGGKHWHGATDKTTQVHMAIQESNDKDENENWLEKVSDKQYLEAGEHQ